MIIDRKRDRRFCVANTERAGYYSEVVFERVAVLGITRGHFLRGIAAFLTRFQFTPMCPSLWSNKTCSRRNNLKPRLAELKAPGFGLTTKVNHWADPGRREEYSFSFWIN